MHLLHLLRTILVKLDNLLAGRRVGRLLKVRAETGDEAVCAISDAVALVRRLGAVGGVVLGVELLEGVEEAAGDAVLGVELESALDGGVANHVALGEVLCEDAGARLVLLGDLVAVAGGLCKVGAVVVAGVGAGAGDGDVVGAELGVVEEEGGLHGRLLFKGDVGILGLSLGCYLDISNFATVLCVSDLDDS